ncbi:MAG: hypothetical protein JSR65_12470 [Proteobacteria bacterium]|nr:hypothetical protein [Pseudomonadota bacterium]
MLKKISLIGVGLALCASAMAQTAAPTTSTSYSVAPTVVAGGCTITGASVFNYNPSTNTLTLVNGVDSCSTSTPGNQTASVQISINPTNYTLGSNAAAPVVSWTNQTPAATVTCSLNPTNGFTVSTSSNTANSGTFTLSTPTTAGTFNFAPVCTTSTSGFNTAVSVNGTASLTVVNGNNNTPGCSATQMSTALGNTTLQRQCSGLVYFQPTGANNAAGPLTDLGALLGNKTFPNYLYTGTSPTFQIQAGYYVALAFTPNATGYVQFAANTSYGIGGTISLSTSPGGITPGAPGVICSLSYGGLNSLYMSTQSGNCRVSLGQTYYVNLAGVDGGGGNACNPDSAGNISTSCGSAWISYTLYARSL